MLVMRAPSFKTCGAWQFGEGVSILAVLGTVTKEMLSLVFC